MSNLCIVYNSLLQESNKAETIIMRNCLINPYYSNGYISA